MTPDEMRQYARSSGNYVKTDIWEALAELCERLDRIALALEKQEPKVAIADFTGWSGVYGSSK